MKLRDAISQLDSLPDEATLFVEKIDGRFAPQSRAFVLVLTDEELDRPVVEVARAKAPGAEYFLEVFIMREIAEGWRENHGGTAPTVDQALELIIFYAENDAYPDSFFSES